MPLKAATRIKAAASNRQPFAGGRARRSSAHFAALREEITKFLFT
jgi:hypothetical protein